MESVFSFLRVFSVVFGSITFIVSMFLLYINFTYEDSLERTIDNLKGFDRDFMTPFRQNFRVAMLCIAYLIWYYFFK